MKDNGEIVSFLKHKDYVMVNNNLGGGAFGKAVILKDPFIDELFVAKKYSPVNDEIKKEFYANFIDEIKILYKLNHRNIVRIYGYYPYEEQFSGYIIMEYIDGENIVSYLESTFSFDSPSLDSIFSQLIDAFCYLEDKNIVHRDIRPSNIMIDRAGDVKIIDFGIGKTRSNESSYDSIASVINRGNANTLPNEYYESKYTASTDMFYLGDLFKSILDNEKIMSGAFDFSYGKIIDRMVMKDPRDRYRNFQEIKKLIDEHDFALLDITPKDKEIYKGFANGIFNIVLKLEDTAKVRTSASALIEKLRTVLNDNLFEDYVQDTNGLMLAIFFDGDVYVNEESISCSIISDFLKWFSNLSSSAQELVLSNLESKFKQLPRYTDDEVDINEIPF